MPSLAVQRSSKHDKPFNGIYTTSSSRQKTDHEPTLGGLARRYNLNADFLTQSLFRSTCFSNLDENVCHDADELFTSSTLGEDAWHVDKHAVKFLASIFQRDKPDHHDDPYTLQAVRRWTSVRLTEPVLQSDPDVELLQLKARNAIHLSTLGMQPAVVALQLDEGELWTSTDHDLPAQFESAMNNEKLAVTRESVQFLTEIASCDCSGKYLLASIRSSKDLAMPGNRLHRQHHLADSENSLYRPLTPPLLPMSPLSSPLECVNDAANMPLASTPNDGFAEEFSAVDALLVKQDQQLPEAFETGDQIAHVSEHGVSDFIPKTSSTRSSSPRSKKLCDLKPETPLIPGGSSDSPAKATANFHLLETVSANLPQQDDEIDSQTYEPDIDAFIAEIIVPFAESAVEQIQSERMTEIDTTMRVQVPMVDKIFLTAPWASPAVADSATRMALSELKARFVGSERRWVGTARLEKTMPWSPFPIALGSIELQDNFDDGSLDRYMAELTMEDIFDVASLTWKPPGLRILGCVDTDLEEEQEQISFDAADTRPAANIAAQEASDHPVSAYEEQFSVDIVRHDVSATGLQDRSLARTGMQGLLRKRKMELEGATQTTALRKTRKSKTPAARAGTIDQTAVLAAIGTIDKLTSFMSLHNKFKEQPQKTAEVVPQPVQAVAPPTNTTRTIGELSSSTKGISRSFPCPVVVPMAQATTIVVSTPQMLNHHFLRLIQSILPLLEFIERAPLSHMMRLGDERRSQTDYHEGDFTLSPSTGLVVVTLQKIKQKPLPGQAHFTSVFDKIALASLIYQRLIILVSEAQPYSESVVTATAGPLDARDCEILAELSSLACSVEADVNVHFVPGSEKELARWVASIISWVASSDQQGFELSQDETQWEHMLRRAGMNAFAAQTVLARLKKRGQPLQMLDGPMAAENRMAGALATFVSMSPDQRLQSFGDIMGGARVLRRVGEAIDGGWASLVSRRRDLVSEVLHRP